jgi:penicillin-binding protein 1A
LISIKVIRATQPATDRPKLSFVKIVGRTVLATIALTSSVISGGCVGLAISLRNLPNVRTLQNYVPSQTSYIYDINGKLLSSLHEDANRRVVSLDQISPELKRAVLAMEDSEFYQHSAVSPEAVLRAFIANFKEGKTVEGGSTLTMQLVKNIYLSPTPKLSRKIAEAVLAIHLEQVFTKDEILQMYLNQIFWGHNSYGAETAAETYFHKSAAQLDLAESAMMAGLIQAPEIFSPFVNYKLAKQRQAIVLNRMVALKWITPAQAEAAQQESIYLGKLKTFHQVSHASYVTDAVIQRLIQHFGHHAVFQGGLRVQTTVDTELQQLAKDTVQQWHERLIDQGYHAGQMALVSVDPRTHFIKALVGGVDYSQSQFNRATESRRQPGSTFKPFVYYTAFASGKYTLDSLIDDSPISFPDGDSYYTPEDYDHRFLGRIPLRLALAQSRNIPAVKLGQAVGLDQVLQVARMLGIKSPLQPVMSLPLGSIELTPLELTGAYATFANNGWQSKTTLLLQVTNATGKVLLDNTPQPRQLLNPEAVAALNQALEGVVDHGTGTAARLDRPAAGKTGTTSDERDAWFVGYVPQLATAIWVGNDDNTPLGAGATGGELVAPIWRDFMKQALKDVPVRSFQLAFSSAHSPIANAN